jgi:formylglycine-generating enzyme required for sulfatase activity
MGFTKKEVEDFKVDLQKDLKKSLMKELEKEHLRFIDLLKSIQGKQHEVTLTKPFYMGKNEVTQEQWEAVMGNNPSKRTKGAKLPVTDVSWEDCQEFIKKLNAKTDGGYRLPTEAEWEYACRAGTTTAYSFGDEMTPKDANYLYSNIFKPVAVGSYKANAFGLYDMHGNICEWCEDWVGDYSAGAEIDPKGPAKGENRVLRGGSFRVNVSLARSSLRDLDLPSTRVTDFGFRLARTVDSKNSVASPTETKPDPVEKIPATGNLLVAPFSEAKAKEVQKELAKNLQKEVEEKADLGEGVKLEMVLVPAGKFKMGFTKKELADFKVDFEENYKKALKKELGKKELDVVDLIMSFQGKQHEVTLTKPFYMGKYEVTQEQWEAVMGNNPSKEKGKKLPVTNVSWEDCQEFIKKLNKKTDGGYRLPTEAEWEYACRAGTTTAYSFGDEMTPKEANYSDSNIGKPVAVGSYKANAFGLYDMHGNVWEWCEDWWEDYPAEAVTDPKGPAKGENRVLRGGSFNNSASIARSSFRNYLSPTYRYSDYGFRLARNP